MAAAGVDSDTLPKKPKSSQLDDSVEMKYLRMICTQQRFPLQNSQAEIGATRITIYELRGTCGSAI